MSKQTARMSENGQYLEWSAAEMGAAIPIEALPIILAALLERAGALKVRIYDNPAQPYLLSPAGDAATGFARLKEWEGRELLLLPAPKETA